MRSGDGWCPFAEQIEGVTTFSSGSVDRVGFCDHTAGGYYGTLRSASFWNGQGVSTHFGISQKGEICQMVNIFDTAFAQGRLGPAIRWPPYGEMNHANPNGYLISSEHEDKQVTNYVWSQEMYEADLKLKRWCIEEVARVQGKDLMRFGLDSLSGHYMFDNVNRKYCPGDGWPREQLYADLTQEDNMANLNSDGSQRIVSAGNTIQIWNNNIPVLQIGSEDGAWPGWIAKRFGEEWVYLRNDGKGGAYWSLEPGD